MVAAPKRYTVSVVDCPTFKETSVWESVMPETRMVQVPVEVLPCLSVAVTVAEVSPGATAVTVAVMPLPEMVAMESSVMDQA